MSRNDDEWSDAVDEAVQRADAAEAAVEQLVGDIHAVSQDYTALRARLRDLRDQWKTRPRWTHGEEYAHELDVLLVDPLT